MDFHKNFGHIMNLRDFNFSFWRRELLVICFLFQALTFGNPSLGKVPMHQKVPIYKLGSKRSILFLYIICLYRIFPKYSDTQKIGCNHSKILTMWLYHRVMRLNDADGMANSVDPDQTAPPLGAVWSGSALFAQAYLSENLGSLRYCRHVQSISEEKCTLDF